MEIGNFKLKIFLFASLPILILVLLPQKAYGEGLNLKISPSILQIRAQTPAEVKAPFTIENQSNQTVKLKIGYKVFNPKQSQEGKIVFLNEGSLDTGQKIFDKMQIVDTGNVALNSLELGPKQQKKLQLKVLIPKDQPSSDSYFSLIFLNDLTSKSNQNMSKSNKKDQSTITTIQGGIGLNVLLAIGALETPHGSIEEFSAPWYSQSGPVPFTLRVKNNGLHFIKPKGVILIKNIFGQTVGRVDIPETAILAGTTRSLMDKEQVKPTSNQSVRVDKEPSQTITNHVIWPEHFLLGFYRADLSIAMSSDGPVYTQTVRFAAFPIQLTLGILIAGVIVVIIYLRVKKKSHKA